MEVADTLRIRWARGSEFLQAFDREGPGRYAVVMKDLARLLRGRVEMGRQVPVELEFVDTNRVFRHSARLVAHASGPPEVAVFEFIPAETSVRELVLLHAEGGSVPYLHRRAERKPVWLPVELELEGRWRRGFATELAELGMYVTITQPPPVDARLAVRIRTANGWLHVRGRVVYARGAPNIGCGIELVFADRADEVRVRTALRVALQAKKRP